MKRTRLSRVWGAEDPVIFLLGRASTAGTTHLDGTGKTAEEEQAEWEGEYGQQHETDDTAEVRFAAHDGSLKKNCP